MNTKNLLDINKEIEKAYWENMVAKGAGLAYDVKNGNYDDYLTKEQLENSQKGSIVL